MFRLVSDWSVSIRAGIRIHDNFYCRVRVGYQMKGYILSGLSRGLRWLKKVFSASFRVISNARLYTRNHYVRSWHCKNYLLKVKILIQVLLKLHAKFIETLGALLCYLHSNLFTMQSFLINNKLARHYIAHGYITTNYIRMHDITEGI